MKKRATRLSLLAFASDTMMPRTVPTPCLGTSSFARAFHVVHTRTCNALKRSVRVYWCGPCFPDNLGRFDHASSTAETGRIMDNRGSLFRIISVEIICYKFGGSNPGAFAPPAAINNFRGYYNWFKECASFSLSQIRRTCVRKRGVPSTGNARLRFVFRRYKINDISFLWSAPFPFRKNGSVQIRRISRGFSRGSVITTGLIVPFRRLRLSDKPIIVWCSIILLIY
mmetsp:Transcript_950/g.2122  ORF Transcript_950/g.2122 Transcript_950/m.2122 type:complete len:226 (-) Transcript_950:590-1267(-)